MHRHASRLWLASQTAEDEKEIGPRLERKARPQREGPTGEEPPVRPIKRAGGRPERTECPDLKKI